VDKGDGEVKVWLNTVISEELKQEGMIRDIVRAINQRRKEMKLTVADKVTIDYETSDQELTATLKNSAEEIKDAVLAVDLRAAKVDGEPVLEWGGKALKLKIVKV